MSERPLQPPHTEPRGRRDEDDAYEAQRQRKLDEETERDEMRDRKREKDVLSAALLLGVTGETAFATLRVLYQLGYMDGVLQASREALL